MPDQTEPIGKAPRRLITVRIAHEEDVVWARRRAREVSEGLGFGTQDQVRIATAVSEVARNAWQYGGGGAVEFFTDLNAARPRMTVVVSDEGGGIADLASILEGRYQSSTGMGLGLAGARRLMDDFDITTSASGTRVVLVKYVPRNAPQNSRATLAALAERLAERPRENTIAEISRQNSELLHSFEELNRAHEALQEREVELGRINQELEDTNRGVVALYAELDMKAVELRNANEVKSRFLSYMSHEFRTPLNSITALTTMLLKRVDGDLTTEQEVQLGYIFKAAQDLYEMVNDLLDLAKVESGRIELSMGSFDVGQLFSALRGLMRPLLPHDGVNLIFEETAFSITSDESKVAQILRNLISNAVKFTASGEIRVDARHPDSLAIFSVSDTGIGIPLEHQERIFEEFAQVENPMQKKVRGTGLGLPLSRKLAELLGGSLMVQSKPGAGSTFTLSIPDHAPLTAVAPSEPVEPHADSILIIDDDEAARYLTRHILSDLPYTILEANNGVEGAERARFERPRLIFLDLIMPGISGFETLDILKSDSATSDIPVIVHSSKAIGPQDEKRLAGRAAAVLPKTDVDPQHAREVIHALLGGSL